MSKLRSSSLAVAAGSLALGSAAMAQNCQWDLGNPGISVSTVRGILEFDGNLLAVGNFNPTGGPSRLARWNGSVWAEYAGGMGNQANDWVIWNDGSGPALFVVGPFTTVGGSITATRAAKWDGTTWSALGAGLGSTPSTMVVWNDGSGEALYVGGSFTVSGTATINRIAKWTGTDWVQFGGGANAGVDVLAVYQGQLHVFGSFTTIGTSSIARSARWNGSGWDAIPTTGVSGDATSGAIVWDDGITGESLYLYGSFAVAGGVTVNGIGRWDGTQWHALAGGARQANNSAAWIRTAAIFNDGTGPALYIGSSAPSSSGFTQVGSGIPALGIARWDGLNWSAPTQAINNNVFSLKQYNDPDGRPVLWAGGQFTTIGGQTANRIARWSCDIPVTPCYANCDGSTQEPILNVADFSCFLGKFAAADPYANCDGSTQEPVLNVADFSCFLGKFAAGCR